MTQQVQSVVHMVHGVMQGTKRKTRLHYCCNLVNIKKINCEQFEKYIIFEICGNWKG